MRETFGEDAGLAVGRGTRGGTLKELKAGVNRYVRRRGLEGRQWGKQKLGKQKAEMGTEKRKAEMGKRGARRVLRSALCALLSAMLL